MEEVSRKTVIVREWFTHQTLGGLHPGVRRISELWQSEQIDLPSARQLQSWHWSTEISMCTSSSESDGRFITDIMQRIKLIKKNVLIEFRAETSNGGFYVRNHLVWIKIKKNLLQPLSHNFGQISQIDEKKKLKSSWIVWYQFHCNIRE